MRVRHLLGAFIIWSVPVSAANLMWEVEPPKMMLVRITAYWCGQDAWTSKMQSSTGRRLVSGKFLGGAALGYGNYGSDMSGFTFSPQFGIRASKMDLILNYTSTSFGGGGSLSFLGIKTAYRF